MEKNQEITECCICTDTFTDPRILTCIHTFCLKCLEQIASKTELNPGDTMACPICKKPFLIPNNGMVGLQKNFFLERLKKIYKLLQPSNGVILCDACKTDTPTGGETNEEPTATQFCIQCEHNICNRCCQYHKRLKDLQRHVLIPIGSCPKDVSMRTMSLQFCDQHSQKKLELYCLKCGQVICMKCFAQNHKTHDCSDIDEIAEKFREQIRRDLEKINGYEAEAASKVEEIVKLKVDFQKTVDDTEKVIIQRGNELKNLVDRHIKSLLEELESTNERVSKEIATERKKRETHKIILDGFDKYCMELINKGSSAEVCRAANDLYVQAEELGRIHEKQINRQISSTEVKFQTSDVERFLKTDNIVGKIRVSIRSNANLTLPPSSSVHGVTKLDDKIYILCYKPNLIRIFDDQNPFKFEKDVEVKGVKNPSDIASCEISKCLYLSESDSRCVWKITINDHQLTKFLTEEQCKKAFTLSITTGGHLLVARRDELLQQLEIYGSDAKLIRRLSLPDGIFWPQHIIQTPNEEFIISHSSSESSFGSWVISRLTRDGRRVIARFQPKDETQVLNGPRRLALDPGKDRFFVADCLNNRVVLFDIISLDLTKVLLTKEVNGISQPWRIYYDRTIKQLIVGQDEGKVEIYEVDS